MGTIRDCWLNFALAFTAGTGSLERVGKHLVPP